jgi:hypothetical protein
MFWFLFWGFRDSFILVSALFILTSPVYISTSSAYANICVEYPWNISESLTHYWTSGNSCFNSSSCWHLFLIVDYSAYLKRKTKSYTYLLAKFYQRPFLYLTQQLKSPFFCWVFVGYRFLGLIVHALLHVFCVYHLCFFPDWRHVCIVVYIVIYKFWLKNQKTNGNQNKTSA